ncbi:DUF1330 domain-containing protein [Bradyrhizobium sp. 170]|uniref:DUF1330 domain-containing protein n=1 Tax=Bradyrhizobium sp. 170 TaxID=2782641 RepID=UPI00200055C5|nr:DUF1330 domain-containing protein [Bradyrhizobium sp. 170]UPK05058.1 DUF1330 domain-containing protein [Bradyrhizobium sp. 170]
MKTSFAVVSALVAGIGIGGFGVNSIHAQAKPPVYMIEDNTVRDPQGFAQEFAPLARESLRVYGGRYLGGGGGVSVDGEPPKGRVVLVQWDSMEQMTKWRHSPEYSKARAVGEKYGSFRIFAVDGVPQ